MIIFFILLIVLVAFLLAITILQHVAARLAFGESPPLRPAMSELWRKVRDRWAAWRASKKAAP